MVRCMDCYMPFLGYLGDNRVANSRVGMCILVWVLSSKGKNFGWSSTRSETLAIPSCSNGVLGYTEVARWVK